jgi:hypothetical protein
MCSVARMCSLVRTCSCIDDGALSKVLSVRVSILVSLCLCLMVREQIWRGKLYAEDSDDSSNDSTLSNARPA